MSERRILTIGSQCDALHTKLSFLPSLAEQAYEVMTDSRLGGCVPALRNRAESLLLDPTVDRARAAIENAFKQASDAESTLFILLIGHGEMLGGEFFFLPIDASIPPTGNRALNLVQIIKELHLGGYAGLDGLVVLIDACFSGIAAAEAAQKWIASLPVTSFGAEALCPRKTVSTSPTGRPTLTFPK